MGKDSIGGVLAVVGSRGNGKLGGRGKVVLVVCRGKQEAPEALWADGAGSGYCARSEFHG